MATKMIDLGIKRKEMYSGEPVSPQSEKKYENEKVYPEVHVSGEHAEMMGAEDMKTGDVVEQTVRWRVKSHTKTEENGKTRYSMDLCLESASDCVECETEDKGEDDEPKTKKGMSPAMAYIQGHAAED